MGLHETLKLFTGSYVPDRHPDLWAAIAPSEGGGTPADARVTADLLAPVVDAASDTRTSVARPAYYVLLVLSDHFTAAQQAVARMAEDSRSHVRVWAVLSVGRRAPRALQLQVIGGGLADRSAQVRRHAANQALSYRLRELLPTLEAAAAGVRSAAVRQEIEDCYRLLRDGYYLTPADRGQVSLTVAFDGGGVGSRLFSREELETRGVDALVSELQARHRRR